ncbi:nucleotide sugar dehydrogenase [Thalassospira sp. ER-Se-21-Dark]|uniref:nucleotide sugar dehydrogenase n=1 Tax=Thalassospira sp. ER-Se-21-Dark TaxID=2585190 RepID=UPI001B309084|nr:nucleotide sugar dehydrogenase [Thalassospira sp. ER-Se-21-Dark]MBP3127843.1 nucleotide sugar dehydrogenase [Thalassospira sp. ER-Se-21-Dark]
MSHGRKISVIGLGYVGLPVAVAFGTSCGRTVAFDINQARISQLKAGHDATGEVDDHELAAADLLLTADAQDLAEADFHVVTVPTPIDSSNRPDLSPLRSASKTVGAILKKGDIVVYESTVYPGATEEVCVPILEELSGLKAGSDFTVGYSPERINPGDREHRFTTITKVVSGQDQATLDIVADVYGGVVTAGIHKAPTIKAAEAAKVIENTQRDLNIALMNELSLIFDRAGIDTSDVLAAAGTKWNFLKFTPGLVGGHCIGVDPYYLTHKSEELGYYPQVVLAGRRVNDGMGDVVANKVIRALLREGATKNPTVTVLGLTFKEDVPDIRNTRVIDIVRSLEEAGVTVQVHDVHADAGEVAHEFDGLKLCSDRCLQPADAVVLAVSHKEYVAKGWPLVSSLLKDGTGFVADVRAVLPRDAVPTGIDLWRL